MQQLAETVLAGGVILTAAFGVLVVLAVLHRHVHGTPEEREEDAYD